MKSPSTPNRRQFLAASASTGAGLLFLPSGTLFGQNRPGNRLNIALIGCWGRATAHFNMLEQENVVALCDVNSKALAAAGQKFPKAKQYKDWRKCLDQKDLDAVVCCTPDHHHAFISIWAMNRGLHVYGEKPLANTVEEARMVRETYLKNRNKVATQCGTQRHFDPNFAYIRELIREGAIGELQDVHAWGDRYHNKKGYPMATGSAPDFIDWDLWVGPSQMKPFSSDYFTALNWRRAKRRIPILRRTRKSGRGVQTAYPGTCIASLATGRSETWEATLWIWRSTRLMPIILSQPKRRVSLTILTSLLPA